MIVLTGFEPFGEYTSNPAGDVAKALDGRAFGAEVVLSAVLPVHHADAASMVSRLLDETAPRAIVHLGLAGARARIALERVAVNVMDFEIADNAGYRAAGEPCVPGGPVAYFSTLPLGAILNALTADGVPPTCRARRNLSLQPDDVHDAPRARAARARHPGGLHPPAAVGGDGGGLRPRSAEHGPAADDPRDRDRAARYRGCSPVRSLRKARRRRFISSGISTFAARPVIRIVARSVRR